MKQQIDIDTWVRRDHFRFFSGFSEPFFGVTVRVDATQAYRLAKERERSFFLHYLYRALKAANSIEAFRYRIVDEKVFLFDCVHASPTINRPDGTFGFAYMDYHENEDLFYQNALRVTEEVRQSTTLIPGTSGQDMIHFSALPWLDFTSLSHARNFAFPDSSPKISFGKLVDEGTRKTMPISVHLHHGLADGYHAGLFVERFQDLMNEK